MAFSIVSLGERDQMRQFICDLHKYILRMEDVPTHLVERWLEISSSVDGPMQLFQLFIASPEVLKAREMEADSSPKWPLGHYYSPIVKRSEARADASRIFGRTNAAGVDLNESIQKTMLAKLAPYIAQMPFSEKKIGGLRYYYDNPSYGVGDASIYWGMMNMLKPNRIIEVGSGFSSALALDAIDRLSLPTTCIFIDPFPEVARRATAPLGDKHKIISTKVQNIEAGLVETLQSGDLLFIDSSHVVKTGSDVHFEIIEILPKLKSGVYVHFHDVFWPFEYHREWVIPGNHSWNEVYFLHAFLMYNESFTIEYFNSYMAKTNSQLLRDLVPERADRILASPGGGIWLRRR